MCGLHAYINTHAHTPVTSWCLPDLRISRLHAYINTRTYTGHVLVFTRPQDLWVTRIHERTHMDQSRTSVRPSPGGMHAYINARTQHQHNLRIYGMHVHRQTASQTDTHTHECPREGAALTAMHRYGTGNVCQTGRPKLNCCSKDILSGRPHKRRLIRSIPSVW